MEDSKKWRAVSVVFSDTEKALNQFERAGYTVYNIYCLPESNRDDMLIVAYK